MAAVNALFDLCARPHLVEPLRLEAEAVLAESDGRWQLKTIKQLKRLDSFLKESLRFNPPDSRMSNRGCLSKLYTSGIAVAYFP